MRQKNDITLPVRFLTVRMALIVSLFAVTGFPYGFQYGGKDSERPLRWNSSKIKVSVSESLGAEGAAGSASELLVTLRRAATTWKEAGAPEIDFSLTPADSVSASGKSGDGVSLLTGSATPENVLLFSGANSTRPAVTRLFYDRYGTITEADIVLNPFYPHSVNGFPGSFDLETTLVHEFGHLFGLGHSDLPGASMYELSARNGLYGLPFSMLRTLSADDIAGIRALYGWAAAEGDCCTDIEGVIPGDGTDDGSWLVWAEDISSGAIESSVIASPDGTFRLAVAGDRDLRLFARGLTGKASAVVEIGELDPETRKLTLEAAGPHKDRAGGRMEGIGINGELAGLAVPLNTGNTYRLYVSVSEWSKSSRISTSSPAIEVDDESYEVSNYGGGRLVVSFVVTVRELAPSGLYSVRLHDLKTMVDSLPGTISIGPESNPFVVHPEAVAGG